MQLLFPKVGVRSALANGNHATENRTEDIITQIERDMPKERCSLQSVLQQYAAAKLTFWQHRHVDAPAARLFHKIPKLTEALQRHFPTLHVTEAAVNTGLQTVLSGLEVPAPTHSSAHLMDQCLGRDTTWERLQQGRAEVLVKDAGPEERLQAYRDAVVHQLTPRLTNDETSRVSRSVSTSRKATEKAVDEPAAAIQRAFAHCLQKAAATYGGIDINAPLDVRRLRKIIARGVAALRDRGGKEALSQVDSWVSHRTQPNCLDVFRLCQQLGHARSSALTATLEDVIWFFQAEDPRGSASLRCSILEQRVRGLLQAMGEALRSPQNMPLPLPLLETAQMRILDTQRPVNIERWTWLQEKLRSALAQMPLRIVEGGGFSKLFATMLSIVVGTLSRCPAALDIEQLDAIAFHAFQVGFYFGIGYPFVDDFLDDQQATKELGVNFLELVPRLENMLWCNAFSVKSLPKAPGMALVREAFTALQALLGDNAAAGMRELALMVHSEHQDATRQSKQVPEKEAFAACTSLIAKSAQTFRVINVLCGQRSDSIPAMEPLAFLGQMLDDFKDVEKDARTGSKSLFSDFYTNPVGKPNPLTLLLQQLLLVDASFGSTPSVQATLGRWLVGSLMGVANDTVALQKRLDVFLPNPQDSTRLALSDAVGPNAKLLDFRAYIFAELRRASTAWSRTNRTLATYVSDHVGEIREFLTTPLPDDPHKQPIAFGKRYVMLAPTAKHMRPLLVFMAGDTLGIARQKLTPLCRSMEYIHTSSLVFDDLPAQDDAPTRRQQPTLHTVAGSQLADAQGATARGKPDNAQLDAGGAEARAQLVGLSLVGEAIDTGTALAEHFGEAKTLEVMRYLAQSVQDLADGQMMDLLTPSRPEHEVDVAYLEKLAELKTGRAFAMCLRSVALLAAVPADTLELLSNFANQLGVLYQIRDDLLDMEGGQTGKQAGIDARNGNKTFVSLLGYDAAKQHMLRIQHGVGEQLNQLEKRGIDVGLLRELVNFVVTRKA